MGKVKTIKRKQVSANLTPKEPTPALFFIPMQTALPGVTHLAQAVQESIKTKRLPIPKLILFRNAFINLISFIVPIEQNSISAAD